MNVKSCEKKEKSQVLLTIEVGPDEFDAAIEKAYKKNRRKYRVPGFRPGKASRKMIEAVYGKEAFYDDAINEAFPDAYQAAVKEKELKVLDMPSVELEGIPTSAGFTFKATVPVYPEVTLGQYKGLSAPKQAVAVTDEDVEERIKRLSERNTRLVSVEREAKPGDTVVIDFEGFLNGAPFEGGKGENHSLEIGSESFVPGFEEQLVGVKAGEEREINITFPDNYAPELAGKDVVFKVTAHEVKEKEAPEIDDEFAKDVSEFDTLEELKADLRRQVTEERQGVVDREYEDNLMNQVADGITADIPDVLIDRQARQFVDNLKRQVYQQGFTYEQYLKMTGGSEEKLLADAQEPALRQVRMDLAVTAIIEQEHLEATDEDKESEYEKLAEQTGMDKESIKKYFNDEQITNQVLTQKAIAVVTESATATEPETPSENAESGAES